MKEKERRSLKRKKKKPSPERVIKNIIKYIKENKKKVIFRVNIIICLIILVIFVIVATKGDTGAVKRFKDKEEFKETEVINTSLEVQNEKVEEEKKTLLVDDSISNDEETKNQERKTTKKERTETVARTEQPKQSIDTSNSSGPWNYRLTSYYTGDGTGSGATTASGKSTSDFQINDKGWYTYQGKLVIATASKRLLSWSQYKNSTSRMFDLYQTLILEIDGVKYEAIVLDVCGAAMRKDIIDLFVKDRASIKDTQIKVYLPN